MLSVVAGLILRLEKLSSQLKIYVPELLSTLAFSIISPKQTEPLFQSVACQIFRAPRDY